RKAFLGDACFAARFRAAGARRRDRPRTHATACRSDGRIACDVSRSAGPALRGRNEARGNCRSLECAALDGEKPLAARARKSPPGTRHAVSENGMAMNKKPITNELTERTGQRAEQ